MYYFGYSQYPHRAIRHANLYINLSKRMTEHRLQTRRTQWCPCWISQKRPSAQTRWQPRRACPLRLSASFRSPGWRPSWPSFYRRWRWVKRLTGLPSIRPQSNWWAAGSKPITENPETLKYRKPGMGEFEKVGNLESQNLDIRNCSRYIDIEKYRIRFIQNFSIWGQESWDGRDDTIQYKLQTIPFRDISFWYR